MSVLTSVNTPESFENKLKALSKQMGDVFTYHAETKVYEVKPQPAETFDPTEIDPEFDREAFNRLRAKIASGG